MNTRVFLLLFMVFKSLEASMSLSPQDPSSFSRPDKSVIKHISLRFDVDFDNKVLNGEVIYKFEVLKETQELILDSSLIDIESVELEDGTKLNFSVDDYIPNYGSKLTISLHKHLTPTETFNIKIKYKTSPKASALNWLDPSQTSGKEHPYLFSQCGPIHARSVVPCQDTPAVKFTYDAVVSAPGNFTVLMSALRDEVSTNQTHFRQPIPIPSYLLAIAVGVMEFRTLGPRSRVWAEKEKIVQSAWEFAETEKYLQAAEQFCGPYEWTQYNLLVLPPSFPFGGMENPCLTFVTPALLAGDRSLADVIVHEIVHSWTGNLVSIKTFEHFWLKEGFTVFIERKVDSSFIEDAKEAKINKDFESLIGLQELKETVNDQLGPNHALTQLVFDLSKDHPDDAITRVPYEKGSLFLRYLEDLVGGGAFDSFVRSYITKFRNKSIDTNEFKYYFLEFFESNVNIRNIDWDTWLYSPGMPPIIPEYDTTKTKAVNSLVETILQGNASLSPQDVKNLNVHQQINLLQELIGRPALPLGTLRDLGHEYGFRYSNNSEILYRWLRLCVRSRDQDRLDDVFDFVNSHGRMKYVRPIYRDLYAWEEIRQRAIQNFLKNEPYMMHVSAYTLRQDLHLDDSKM